jgi:hypothetical protein
MRGIEGSWEFEHQCPKAAERRSRSPDAAFVMFGTCLLQCLVVDKTRSILGHLELPFLDLLAEFPASVSAGVTQRLVQSSCGFHTLWLRGSRGLSWISQNCLGVT